MLGLGRKALMQATTQKKITAAFSLHLKKRCLQFAASFVSPLVSKPSGATAQRGKRHLTQTVCMS